MTAFHHTMWLGKSSSSADHAHAWHGGGGSGGHLLQPTTLTHGTAEVAREVIFFSRPRSRMARRRWLGRSSSSADHAHAWHGGGGSGGHLLQPTTLTHGTAEVAREVIFFSRPRSRMARRRWLGRSSSSADHAHAWHGGGGSGGHLLQPTTLTHGTAEVAREVIFFSRPRSRMARRRWLGRSSSSADHAHAWLGGGGSGGTTVGWLDWAQAPSQRSGAGGALSQRSGTGGALTSGTGPGAGQEHWCLQFQRASP
ncbi:uncharacterized protein LOC114365146 isoform X3 [Ostrinia furnacalis]|uniref:uncharacterized protein LOC114365146 isoform X3 n=1 Tax=Ostrinia furnacalis TaxID=93504 RepID=UPI001040394A|nr:uncharacterized protein LOC114365146 isoform X3 [Ostrinia furnacalis]